MYDKVKLWIDRAMVGRDCSTIADYLDDANYMENRDTGERKIYGSFHGLKVTAFPHGVSVVGSLTKLLHDGSNIYTLNRHDTEKAICLISDGLHIPMDEAKVTGLEVGANLFLRHAVPRYIDRLGIMPYKKRIQIEPSAISYRGAGKQRICECVFYDKIADARAKQMNIPTGFEQANLLRYENKYTKRVSEQMGQAVTASTLYDAAFFRKVAFRWRDGYFSIKKNQINKTDMSNIKTPTDAFNALVARLISQSGGRVVEDYMKELEDNEVFKTREEYRRAREKFKKAIAWDSGSVSDELITELDDEVRNAVANL